MVHPDIGREPAQDVRQFIMGAAVQRRLVKIPSLLRGPEGALELVLDVEQPDTNGTCEQRIGNCTSKNGPSPTSQIVVAARTAIARFVAIVLSQKCQLLRISPTGSRCCKTNRYIGPTPNITIMVGPNKAICRAATVRQRDFLIVGWLAIT